MKKKRRQFTYDLGPAKVAGQQFFVGVCASLLASYILTRYLMPRTLEQTSSFREDKAKEK